VVGPRPEYNSGMPEPSPPYWLLISVLFSSVPLTPALAGTLHQAAYDLYSRDAAAGPVAGDIVSGLVRNLRKEMLLGTIAGPAFEAELETARGPGKVRFLLTRQGLELMEQRVPERTARRELLN
jgi:hypothetical protein